MMLQSTHRISPHLDNIVVYLLFDHLGVLHYTWSMFCTVRAGHNFASAHCTYGGCARTFYIILIGF